MKFFRTIFIGLCMAAGGYLAVVAIPDGLKRAYLYLNPAAAKDPTGAMPNFTAPFSSAALAVFGAITLGLVGLLSLSWLERVVRRWAVMSNAERTTVYVSIIVGVGVSIPFHMLTFSFGSWAVLGSLVLMCALIALSYASLKSMDESLPWSRMAGHGRSNTKVFDTNVIIDGRIYEVTKNGFLEGKIYIPEFVLKELQSIADSHDANRRQRGRRGLDMLRLLQQDCEVEIGVQDRFAGEPNEPVDNRLVKLAKGLGASLVTNDFNLNKVAQVHGVRVLNVNDLAIAMRPQYHPNDVISVQIEREGSQPGQGVGFLDDGTMVVVEEGAELIGDRVDVKVSQVHQSAAGRMIFATMNGFEGASKKKGLTSK